MFQSSCRSIVVGLWLIGSVSACSDSERTGGPLPGVARAPEERDFRGKSKSDEFAPTPPAEPAQLTADQVFATRCASCHGQDGAGHGPAAAMLNPRPRNYRDPAWQKTVTDEHIKKTIVEGGAAVGKSPAMAPNADLANQPVVVDGLVKIVRGFAKEQGT